MCLSGYLDVNAYDIASLTLFKKAKSEHKRWTTRYKEVCEDLEDAKDNARKAEDLLLSSATTGSGGTTDPELLSNLNKANDRVS